MRFPQEFIDPKEHTNTCNLVLDPMHCDCNCGRSPLASNYELAAQEKGFSGALIRSFSTGATRTSDVGKPDFEGFISPIVIERYGEYMNKHRVQPDGQIRESDNWTKGIPKSAYMKSGYRHFMDWWMDHRGYVPREPIEEALCALIFNASGYLREILVERGYRME